LAQLCEENADAAEARARPALALSWRVLATVVADDGSSLSLSLSLSLSTFILQTDELSTRLSTLSPTTTTTTTSAAAKHYVGIATMPFALHRLGAPLIAELIDHYAAVGDVQVNISLSLSLSLSLAFMLTCVYVLDVGNVWCDCCGGR
jgi:hypothetical protein